MLTKELIKELKADGMSFEQITDLNSRMESVENGTAEFIDSETFWSGVYQGINSNIKERQCIK